MRPLFKTRIAARGGCRIEWSPDRHDEAAQAFKLHRVKPRHIEYLSPDQVIAGAAPKLVGIISAAQALKLRHLTSHEALLS